MKSQTSGLLIASLIFALIALVQLVRLFVRPDIVVAGHLLPLWPSGIAVVLFAGLSLWMWKLAHPRIH
jgi:hypothetical protein